MAITKTGEILTNLALLAVGCFLSAISVALFILPNEFAGTGLTGVALLIHYNIPSISMGAIYFAINIPVFILGYFYVGRRFIIYTGWGVLCYSLFLGLLNFDPPVDDKLLSAFVGGGLTGIGVALALRSYGSAGGADILCVIFNKFFGIPLGTGALLMNSAVLLAALLFIPLENVLYTLIFITTAAKTTDTIFHSMSQRKAALIITDHWQEIASELTGKYRIGVTLINGVGGYKGTGKTILYSVLNKKKVPGLKKTVAQKDAKAFIAIMEASDVTGVEVGNQPHW